MKDIMVVETRDLIEIRDVEWGAGLLADLQASGSATCMMLAENGVFAARKMALAACLIPLIGGGVTVLADRFALRERGIAETDLVPGVAPADLGVVIDWLEAGASVLWR